VHTKLLVRVPLPSHARDTSITTDVKEGVGEHRVFSYCIIQHQHLLEAL